MNQQRECSKLITANRLWCIHLLQYCKVFHKYIFTRYISLATGSACSFYHSLHNVYLPPWQPSCNNFAFLVFSFCTAFPLPPPTDRWLIVTSMLFCVIIIIITAFHVIIFDTLHTGYSLIIT